MAVLSTYDRQTTERAVRSSASQVPHHRVQYCATRYRDLGGQLFGDWAYIFRALHKALGAWNLELEALIRRPVKPRLIWRDLVQWFMRCGVEAAANSGYESLFWR
jgi:hypothetical protein